MNSHEIHMGSLLVGDEEFKLYEQIKSRYRLNDEEFGRVAGVLFMILCEKKNLTIDINLSDPEKTGIKLVWGV